MISSICRSVTRRCMGEHEALKKALDEEVSRRMTLEHGASILDTQNQLLLVEIAALREQVAKKHRVQ